MNDREMERTREGEDEGRDAPPLSPAVPSSRFSISLSPYVWCWLALIVALLLSGAIGPSPTPPLDTVRILIAQLPFVHITPDWPSTSEIILLSIRLPRTVLVALTGAALAGSGAAYQGLFRNPLADPYLIGIASGAGLGAVIAMSWQWPATFLGQALIPAAALVGALLTVALVYRLARVGKTTPVTTLILAGVAVGSFATALTTFLMLQASGELRRAINWLLGGFAIGGWPPVAAALPYIAVGLITLVLLSPPPHVLQFRDAKARQTGLKAERVKLILIVAASLAAAAAVAFSGIIGFVGLAVPHLVRLLWGPDYRRLVPLSIIGGAGAPKRIAARLAELRDAGKDTSSDYDREKLQERLAKLIGGVAVINVGAATEMEMKEKKDRVEDALNATRAAVEEGIVPGGGVAYLRALKGMEKVQLSGEEQMGMNIIKRALEEPVRQIANNAGFEGSVVVQKVMEGKGAFGFNAERGVYEDLMEAGIIDPTKVTRFALQNATSVAGLLLTTEAMVAEKPEKKKPAGAPAMPPEDMY